MWVRPSGRGHGIGEALIGATADWAKARGHDCLLLWVTESNAAAIKLYDRCGFALTGSVSRSPRIRPCPRSRCGARSDARRIFCTGGPRAERTPR